jgi:hypothetical protein
MYSLFFLIFFFTIMHILKLKGYLRELTNAFETSTGI